MKTAWRAIALGLSWVVVAAYAAEDPRPVVLMIGDRHLEAIDYSAGIPQELQARHPEWRVVSKVIKDCTITAIQDGLDGLLADVPAAGAVVLLTGTYEAFDGNYSVCDAGSCGRQMGEVLKALKAKPATAKAAQVVILPMPVMAERLEQPMQSRIADGDVRSKALADAYRKAAETAGAKVVDLHTFVLGFVNPSGAETQGGWLLGRRGWTVREWGLPYVTDFVCKELESLAPASATPEAYDALRKETEANRKLDAILSQTSEGVVACGPALATGEGAKAKTWTVPADRLAGSALDILVATEGGTGYAGIMAGSAADSASVPELTVETEGGAAPVAIKPLSYEWQEICEAAPDKVVKPDSWAYNAKYTDYFHPIVGGKAGERRQCLIRFPLAALSGVKVLSASLRIPGAGVGKTGPGLTKPDMTGVGPLKVFPVTGPDRNWHFAKATWKTRDGEIGWTGGKVDTAKRKAMIEEFLKTDPPAGAAERARGILKGP